MARPYGIIAGARLRPPQVVIPFMGGGQMSTDVAVIVLDVVIPVAVAVIAWLLLPPGERSPGKRSATRLIRVVAGLAVVVGLLAAIAILRTAADVQWLVIGLLGPIAALMVIGAATLASYAVVARLLGPSGRAAALSMIVALPVGIAYIIVSATVPEALSTATSPPSLDGVSVHVDGYDADKGTLTVQINSPRQLTEGYGTACVADVADPIASMIAHAGGNPPVDPGTCLYDRVVFLNLNGPTAPALPAGQTRIVLTSTSPPLSLPLGRHTFALRWHRGSSMAAVSTSFEVRTHHDPGDPGIPCWTNGVEGRTSGQHVDPSTGAVTIDCPRPMQPTAGRSSGGELVTLSWTIGTFTAMTTVQIGPTVVRLTKVGPDGLTAGFITPDFRTRGCVMVTTNNPSLSFGTYCYQ